MKLLIVTICLLSLAVGKDIPRMEKSVLRAMKERSALNRVVTSNDDPFDYTHIVCNSPDVLKLSRPVGYQWTASNADLSGDQADYYYWESDSYPPGTECKVKFLLPAGETLTMYMEIIDIPGDLTKDCADGDYVQLTVDGKPSKKLCGYSGDFEDWVVDWAIPAFHVPKADHDQVVEAHFVSKMGGQGGLIYSEADGFLLSFDIWEPTPALPME